MPERGRTVKSLGSFVFVAGQIRPQRVSAVVDTLAEIPHPTRFLARCRYLLAAELGPLCRREAAAALVLVRLSAQFRFPIFDLAKPYVPIAPLFCRQAVDV